MHVQKSIHSDFFHLASPCSVRPRIGLFGIGLETYWPQFEGLRERLTGYQDEIARHLNEFDADVVNVGLVDSPNSAVAAARQLKSSDVSVVFLYVSTYALSSTVLPVVQKLGVPVVVLNLQPSGAIDYTSFNSMNDRTKMTGEWLAHCQACSVPEIANVFLRSGIPFRQVTGILKDDPIAWNKIELWIRAVRVMNVMKSNRCGVLGHYYNGMLDIYSDLTRFSSTFGTQVEILEMPELRRIAETVTENQIDEKVEVVRDHFDIQSDCSEREIRRASRTSVALDILVERHGLNSLAYFYNGTGDETYVDLIGSVIVGNSLLTARGIPVAGECEIKNVHAMKILDSFNAGGSFSEFYAMDFHDDVVLLGHDGPGHTKIAEGKTKLRSLQVYHGKVGSGLSVEMSVKNGPVTLLSVIDTPDGTLRFLVAEGESVPGPILELGNTNSRYRFSTGARQFIDDWCSYGPAHHCAIGIGHLSDEIKTLGHLLGIETVRVC